MTTENMNFGADVSRLLEIVTHALYTNRDVFLRELVSNSADACDRLRYDAIANPDLIKGHKGYGIHIYPDTKTRTLVVEDSGVGMTRAELVENLGTIAKSGTKALMEQLKQSGSAGGPSLIGQFGVGFYEAFMVASHVDVISRAAGASETWIWSSNGTDGFTIREATADESARLMDVCGTTVILTIKDEACDFLLDEKIKMVVTTYSNHISLPVYVGEDTTTPVNSASALWMKPKSEVTEEQYNEFFAITSGSMGMDKPAVISHWRAEGKIEYSALLFIPTLRPWDLHDPTRRPSVRLYVRRVFITDDCEGLVYPWLRFMRGVIDSEDLPLNISRETLQSNPVIQKIRSGVTKHILGDLDKLSKSDPIAFNAFWHQFGAVVKEGLYDAHDHREDIYKIARFYSTNSTMEMTSLEDYVARMQPHQDSIYYISGENVENLRNSPQIEGLKKRGLEVLLMKDTIDDFWLPVVMD
ncbi:MAG: molecular chaperone HtpG, partial [Pseudomonadota bacterium]